MSRDTLSQAALRAMTAHHTGEAFLVLLDIDHEDLAETLSFTSDGVNTVSNGRTYQSYPFDVELPAEEEERPPRVTLSISNVSQEIVRAIRSLSSPPTIALSVVLGSSPSTLEAGPFHFTLKSAEYDVLTVEGQLSYEDILDEPYPKDSFTPNLYPGLFV